MQHDEKTEKMNEEKQLENDIKETDENKEVGEKSISEENGLEETVESETSNKEKKVAVRAKEEISSKLDKARQQVDEAYKAVLDCRHEVEEKVHTFEEKKEKFITTTFKESEELLKELGEPEEIAIDLKEAIVVLPEEKEPMVIKNLPTGKIKGFISGTLSAAAVVALWYGVGNKLAGLPLSIQSILDKKSWDTLAGTIPKSIGLGESMVTGYAIIAGSAILVGAIVCKTVVWLQERKNRKRVEEIENEVKNYCSNKEECRKQTQALREHLENMQTVLEKYAILLEEQNAKLKRIIFIEKPQSYKTLHEKSKAEMTQTRVLLEEIRNLLEIPIAPDGNLNPNSVEALRKANRVANEFVRSLYD